MHLPLFECSLIKSMIFRLIISKLVILTNDRQKVYRSAKTDTCFGAVCSYTGNNRYLPGQSGKNRFGKV